MSAKKAPTPVPGDLGRHPGANILTGEIDDGVDMRIAALPFVREREGGRCFWLAKSSGNYETNYQCGYDWSRLVLPFLRYNVGGPLVSWIVADMIRTGEVNGLTLGFARGLADLDVIVKMAAPIVPAA